jgi:hypothetical protein
LAFTVTVTGAAAALDTGRMLEAPTASTTAVHATSRRSPGAIESRMRILTVLAP